MNHLASPMTKPTLNEMWEKATLMLVLTMSSSWTPAMTRIMVQQMKLANVHHHGEHSMQTHIDAVNSVILAWHDRFADPCDRFTKELFSK